MHIGLVIYGSLDTLSGGYLYDRMLVAALRRAGHRVSVFSAPWRTYADHLTDNWRRSWAAQLLHADVDLWLQDELNHPSLFALNRVLRQRHRAPIVAIVHHLRSSEEHPAALLPLYRCVERAYLSTLDAYLANSYTTRATVTTLRGGALPVHVAWPAADHLAQLDEIEPATIAARAVLGARLRVLFVGNLIPRKGLHHLLAALARVESPWELAVVGGTLTGDAYANQIGRQIRHLGISQHVRFLGRVSDDELAAHYRSYHLLAVPSYEGFGIVYLEAHRAGLPVIALTAGAAHEVVIDGQTGFLVPPADPPALASALARIAEDRTLLVGMGLAARLRYTLHPTWAQSMDGAVQWLERVTRG